MNSSQKILRSIVLLFTLSFIQAANAFQQNQHIIDSLKKAVAIEKVDTNKVKLLLKIGIQYSDIMADTALYYFHEALEIAENIKEKEFIAESLIHSGNSHRQNGSPDLAIEYLERALKISEETGDKKKTSYMLCKYWYYTPSSRVRMIKQLNIALNLLTYQKRLTIKKDYP